MSNLGLERVLGGNRLALHRTQVGDRYVVEAMRAGGFNVGGEQSGHIILSDHATTGDGLIAALHVLAEVVEAGKPASEVLHLFDPLPQLLRNIRYAGGAPLEQEGVKAAIAEAEARLNGTGRLVIRRSGTEPVIRVMAEGEDEALVADVVGGICDAFAGAAT
jgi:phosphoglucosamine mutase